MNSCEIKSNDSVTLLAKRLHTEMEFLDPAEDEYWDSLTERRKAFYCLSIEAVLREMVELRLSPTTIV